MHSLYRSSTQGPEDDSVESKHVAPLSHYMFNFTTVVFDGTSPAFYEVQTREIKYIIDSFCASFPRDCNFIFIFL